MSISLFRHCFRKTNQGILWSHSPHAENNNQTIFFQKKIFLRSWKKWTRGEEGLKMGFKRMELLKLRRVNSLFEKNQELTLKERICILKENREIFIQIWLLVFSESKIVKINAFRFTNSNLLSPFNLKFIWLYPWLHIFSWENFFIFVLIIFSFIFYFGTQFHFGDTSPKKNSFDREIIRAWSQELLSPETSRFSLQEAGFFFIGTLFPLSGFLD